MAMTQTLLTSDGTATGATSFTTASITPTGYRVIIVGVANRDGTTAEPTVSGCGISWTKIDTQNYFTNGYQTSLFWGMAPNPSTGTLTIDYGAQTPTAALWIVTQLTEVDVYDPIVQSVEVGIDGNASSITVTLAAFASADNGTIGMIGSEGVGFSIDNGAGFTEIAEEGFFDTTIGMMEFNAGNDTSVDASSSNATSHKWGGIAVELNFNDKPPTSGGAFLMNFV